MNTKLDGERKNGVTCILYSVMEINKDKGLTTWQ